MVSPYIVLSWRIFFNTISRSYFSVPFTSLSGILYFCLSPIILSDKRWKHRGLNQNKDQEGKGSICGSEEHLEDENDQQENKEIHFQEQCTERTAICCRVLESD